MTANKSITYFMIIVIAMMQLAWFGGKPKTYGKKISTQESTSLAKILTDPESFENKTVVVSGKIFRECPTGCWFEVKEKNAILLVELSPSGIAIPQKVGKKVVVMGIVKLKDKRPYIIGEGVKIG